MLEMQPPTADLEYLRAIKQDRIDEFAKKHKMRLFTLSAKTGDRIKTMFLQLGAALAGVELSDTAIEAAKVRRVSLFLFWIVVSTAPLFVQTPVPATITDFERNDKSSPVVDLSKEADSKKCSIL